MMNNKFLTFTIILGLIIIGISLYFLLPLREKSKGTIPENWERFSSGQFDFTLRHPSSADITTEAGFLKIVYLGPDTIQNSEITDGFSLYIRKTVISSGETLESFARETYEESTEQQESISRPDLIAIGDRNGYGFEVRSLLGNTVTYNILEAEDRSAFIIFYSIADPNDSGYQNLVHTIIRSIEE